jgi:branched-chain amino acid transport system ATP-binding protein
MLTVENIRVVYHDVISVLNGISLDIKDKEIVTLIGGNGAGKTTILRSICGLIEIFDGDIIDGNIWVGETSIKGLDSVDIIKNHGITYVMEDRPVFWYLTVEENLEATCYCRRNKPAKQDMDHVYGLFPVLGQLRSKPAGYLSGGEQQMLAIGMALMTQPRLLLLDEPSIGLAPLIVDELFEIIRRLNQGGLTILLVEQNANAALRVSHRGYVIENGRIVLTGESKDLLKNEDVMEFYLGAGDIGRKSYQDAKRYKRRKRWL